MRHAQLEQALRQILASHPQGLSEYQLIKLLQQAPYQIFEANALSDSLSLFQLHFVLFHSLYQLRSEYRQQGSAELMISASLIKLLPYSVGTSGLGRADKLATYYLDWQNFECTAQADVEDLLSQFWRRMGGMPITSDTSAELEQACAFFALSLPCSMSQLRARYRHLQHQYHPDKGGDTELAQQLDVHYQRLKRYLS